MKREDIIRMAKEAGFRDVDSSGMWVTDHYWDQEFEAFAKLVAAAEREECAKLCDELADAHEKLNQWESYKTADVLAQAILARGGE